ncbi:MAG: branched-chain amino acid ABC transporter permease [Thermoleophilia bacterium]|nr:branched-chain amino acid ABC transporter permease [Thermoleophilia bacterium]
MVLAPTRSGLRRVAPLAVPVILACLIVLLASFAASSVQRTVTTMLVNLVLVVGLYVFVGNSGVLSFGHIGFMAIGAYADAIFTIPVQLKKVMLPHLPAVFAQLTLPTPVAVLAAGLAAALVALLVSLPLMRMSLVTLPIATLAFLVIVRQVLGNWESVTRGVGTMLGIPIDTTMTSALLWAVVAMVVAFLFQGSRFGLRLRACREEEVAARALGIGVTAERTIAFVLSAFLAGAAGALYGHELGSLYPDAFYFSATFLVITMLIIGGSGSLAGAFTGTVLVSAAAEILRRAEGGFHLAGLAVPARPGLGAIVLAVVMLLALAYRPQGITRGRESGIPRLGGGRPVRVPQSDEHPDRLANETEGEV